MFDVSSGEMVVLIGLGVGLIGRRDLPAASRTFGRQVGKVVGVLQGARARADRFAADNELKALQNELRSGLRELDAVRGELAVAAGSGLVGRGLGSTVPGADARRARPVASAAAGAVPALGGSAQTTAGGMPPPSSSPVAAGQDYLAAARAAEESLSTASSSSPLELAPRSHAVAAVAEEEWEKRGIGFTSRAERGTGSWEGMGGGGASQGASGEAAGAGSGGANAGGATILADLIQQSLIHDQYDRAVREQDEALNRRAEDIRDQQRAKKQEKEE